MHLINLIILIGWAVFWIGWLAASLNTKPGRYTLGRYAGLRIVVAVVIFVLVRLGAFRHHVVTTNPWAQGVGLALFVLGLALAVWARVYIGRNWGTPMSRKDDPELVTTGPYRLIRHPIYTGIILALIGTALALSLYVLAIAALGGAYFIFSAHEEERYMTERFPDTYPAYRDRTKMLIPFVF